MPKFERWFGIDLVVNVYGSSEGEIIVLRTADTPPEAVGPMPDGVVILGPDGAPAPDGAAGGICRIPPLIGSFLGYVGSGAGAADDRIDGVGVYHSGDVRRVIRLPTGRFLAVDGRSGDWIRKDGENFYPGPITAVVPAGLLARATRTVSTGTSAPRRGRTDITHSSGTSPDSHVPARLAPSVTAVSQIPRFPTEPS